MTSHSPRWRGRLVPLLGALALAACDIPSEPPIFQQTWIVPADSVTVSVQTLLPNNVAVNGGATAFVVTTPTVNINSTLGAICGQPACQNPTPTAVPNTPAFTSPGGALGTTINFPAGVSALTVTGGTLQIQVTNNIGFDPLRPNGAGTGPYGSISIGITSGGVNSNTVINGSPTQGMPNGAMTTLNVALPLGNYTSSVSVAVTVTAPAGGAATVASGNTFTIGASLQNFAVSNATVVVNAKAVNPTPSDFDLSEVDVGDLVQGGGLILDIVNPFNAIAAMQLTLAAPAQGGSGPVTINKPLNVAANGTSTVNVSLSESELDSLLGKSNVTIGVNGTATGTGAGQTVQVSPAQSIIVRTKLSLILNVGG